MNIKMDLNQKNCKYCNNLMQDATTELLKCSECNEVVHLKCLKRGSVPGGLSGDVFFYFTCQSCSTTGNENFVREKMSWLQIIVLVLYHMQSKSSGLARKGFFHWKVHIAAFINKYWDILFRRDFRRKKKWTGTIAGTLSHFSPHFFQSGTTLFNEPGWWTLTYPKLSPFIMTHLNSKLIIKKQNFREENNKLTDDDLFKQILKDECINSELLTTVSVIPQLSNLAESNLTILEKDVQSKKDTFTNIKLGFKKKSLLPTLENYANQPPQKMLKLSNPINEMQNVINSNTDMKGPTFLNPHNQVPATNDLKKIIPKAPTCILDRFCCFQTSIKCISSMKGIQLTTKIMGGIREELLFSPYSTMFLKPYIRRDCKAFPLWLKLMAEIQIVTNKKNPRYILPHRASIDYTYLQPEQLPAINSLCNHYFWPGIDLTECLQYPDFSCVVSYKKLIVGFAFLIPNVKFNESYLSFIFTRPGWRNVGIGKFMIYHLIQTSTGKDITLHVSINNSALLLYQMFGFKVEHVELDFYDKYVRNDTKESKHAFFCRLER